MNNHNNNNKKNVIRITKIHNRIKIILEIIMKEDIIGEEDKIAINLRI